MGCIVLNFWSLFRSYWGHSEKRELQQSSCERKKSSGSLNREKMVYWVDTMQFKVSSLDQINYTYSYSKMLVKAPQQWNSLPSDTRHTQPTQAFKTALKTHLYKTIPQVTSNSVFLLPPPPPHIHLRSVTPICIPSAHPQTAVVVCKESTVWL